MPSHTKNNTARNTCISFRKGPGSLALWDYHDHRGYGEILTSFIKVWRSSQRASKVRKICLQAKPWSTIVEQAFDPVSKKQNPIERPPMLSSRSFSLNSATRGSATCCLSRLAVRGGRSTRGLRRVRSEASPCRHHVSRPRSLFVELLISRNESIPQQLSSDGHKGSAVERLWIHDSQPCACMH